jgi:hypothetical protein
MNFVDTLNVSEQQTALSSEQTFPVAPFPRKYIHSAFRDLQDAVQAFTALLNAGYDSVDIHLMTGRDFVEAVEQRQTLFGFLSTCFFCSTGDAAYLHDAQRGHHMLSVRLATWEQMQQIRELLTPYGAHSMTYVDTWTMAVLSA